MDTAFVYELIGYVASALIVLSLMMQSLLRLRVINLVGAAIFTVYGLLIDAPPVWLVNGAIVVIDIWYLRRMLTDQPDEPEVLEVAPDSRYLRRFVEARGDDIRRFVPTFDGVRDDHHAFFVLRDLVPAALVLARRDGDGDVAIDLDYALPAYRDFTSGRYVYGRSSIWESLDAERLVAPRGHPEHDRYLTKMGFQPEDDRLVLHV